MSIRLALCDFDGTLVQRDLLDELCKITGNYEQSKMLNKRFQENEDIQASPLIERIKLLNGVSLTQIENKLAKNNYLIKGAIEFFGFLKKNNIISVVHSGNIEPVIKYYQNILKFEYYVATPIYFIDGKIDVERKINSNNKVIGCKNIIKKLNIPYNQIIAIGDSIADVNVFELARYSIAINSKGGLYKYATYMVDGDMFDVAEIIMKLV